MKINTFRAYVRQQNILLKIPYFLICLAMAGCGFVALYRYCYVRQTEIAEAIKANTLGAGELEVAITHLTSVMGQSLTAMLILVVVSAVATAWRTRVLERGYTEQVLARMDNRLLISVARSEEVCDDTRHLAQALLNTRAPGWSLKERAAD